MSLKAVKRISQKLKKLKAAAAANDDFVDMVERLKKAGVFKKHEYTGQVTYFKHDKGYGFIRASDGKEFFLHRTDISNQVTPEVGDRFKFNLGSKNRAIKAYKIN